jgi:hypothetical protein
MSSESSSGPRQVESIGEYRLNINSIVLKKINDESIDITRMLAGLNIYQSIFQPFMKADIMLYDAVSLHTNFPLVGEETIEITWSPTSQGTTGAVNEVGKDEDEIYRLVFCIDKVEKQVVSSKGTESIYILTLYSIEMLDNVKKRIQAAYNTTYTSAIGLLLENELNMTQNGKKLKGMTDLDQPEASKGSFKFIVPNMKPLDALLWMAKRAVSTEYGNGSYFVFFERFDGFYFNTIGQMTKYQLAQSINHNYNENYPRVIKRYYYIPNYNETAMSVYSLPINAQQRVLTSLTMNKRYSTFQKILGGYFENELYQIDVYNKEIISTPSTVLTSPIYGDSPNSFNSKEFKNLAITKDSGKGTKTKIKYAIVQDQGDYPSAPNYFSEKYNEALRTQTAMAQINISVTALGDTRVQAGDVIEIKIPPAHGFTETSKYDEFLTGPYLITDIKHAISIAGEYTMVMNLNRDTYSTPIENKQNFTLNTPSAVSNPAREN